MERRRYRPPGPLNMIRTRTILIKTGDDEARIIEHPITHQANTLVRAKSLGQFKGSECPGKLSRGAAPLAI